MSRNLRPRNKRIRYSIDNDEDSDYSQITSSNSSDSSNSERKTKKNTYGKKSKDQNEKLTEYEKLRERNIQERLSLLNGLNLGGGKKAEKKSRPKKSKDFLPIREPSARLQNKSSDNIETSKMPLRVLSSPATDKPVDNPERCRHDSGPVDMFSLYSGSNEDCQNIINTLRNASEDQFSQDDVSPPLMTDELVSRLSNLSLTKDHIVKVTNDRVFAITVHPGNSVKIVSSGGKDGAMSIWNLMTNEVHKFEPHVRAISCLEYNRDFPQQLVSCSYDGTVRCTDLNKTVFNEVYKMEEDNYRNWISYFDFLSPSSLCLALGTGKVSVADLRTNKILNAYTIMDRALKTISVHPSKRDYFVVSTSNGIANIFDLRKMKKKPTPVSSLEHAQSVNSGFFSPCTGQYILTTSLDNNIRVFNSSAIVKELPVIKKLKHDNQVGRWLTNFKAVWLPEREDSFVVGSMLYPRQIQVYSAPKGILLHAFKSDHLQSVSSVNAFHPDLSLIAGGNSSGYMFVFQ